MLTTDITSYFEFVDIPLLIEELKMVPGIDEDLVNLLHRLLDGFSRGSELNGLPQGPEVSSLLGNFYLRPLDAVLRKLDVKFLRFQDDIKVFAGEDHVLRKAIAQLTPVVRGRRLNMSTSKAKILEGAQVVLHFEDSRKDAIQYRIEVDDGEVIEDIRLLFDEAVAGEVNERDVKFSVYRLGKFGNPYAVDWILANLSSVPYLSEILVGYLSGVASERGDIEPGICMFLSDDTRNISPYVEIQLVRMFSSFESISDETYRLLWDILLNPAKESRVREFAARAVGRHLTSKTTADLKVLDGIFRQNPDDLRLRRALLIGMKEGGGASKNYLGTVATGSPELKPLCDYLKSGVQLPKP